MLLRDDALAEVTLSELGAILVTGGSGFIVANLVRLFVEHSVRATVMPVEQIAFRCIYITFERESRARSGAAVSALIFL
jgi:dTDP-D-glucose 4,6-dehydratase